ncbi:alpha/beta hydrolase [Geoalkalibacter halelectricus]|uniref:Alpha/beta hydrolase n=1 Tax=Geoalkalibacter halelectricus TaxID=2847045 RepID=A0ABY5ZFS8_9BACT|nr:alpha/beta hydrolase [Geoalkalibacter halelectricus]MDO3377906.1 alpha/beta hydrolase [Geoalkalibacter halelectricus]UWZ77913.1 alpha/beta hydrolase [Geoalkalibacter halelectricus]
MTADLLNHPLIAARYFFPRPDSVAAPFWVEAGDARLACHYHRPHPQGFTLVHFHGNGEVAADWSEGFPEVMADLGLNCLVAEFRGYGGSTSRPLLGAMLDDVAALIRAADTPPERLILFGRSVGSLFAVHGVSLFPDIAGLILESAVADVLERLLLRLSPGELGVSPQQLAAAVAERLDQRSKMASYPGHTLVMHARGDSLVDVSHGERLHAWAGGPKRLRIFARGDHNNLMFVNQREYFGEIADFVAQLS